MKFALIICSFQRPKPLLALLDSVQRQEIYPDEIIIVDGSIDRKTEEALFNASFTNLRYFSVGENQRGLTKQRNYGIAKTSEESEVIFFLDDDILLEPSYFKEIIRTYEEFPEAVGVSGYITNESDWREIGKNYSPTKKEFWYDNWVRTEGSRFQLRRKFGLEPDVPPGMMPDFSHGYSVGFLPPSGKTYEVEMLMGGIASYRRSIFKRLVFSTYFQGYSLYEDADFSIRASKLGKLYVNTRARLEHHHAQEGRPNTFKYGQMVVRNGWYVWRGKFPNPSARAILKWHATSFLLTLVRLGNGFSGAQKRLALAEALGRFCGWLGLMMKPPRISKD